MVFHIVTNLSFLHMIVYIDNIDGNEKGIPAKVIIKGATKLYFRHYSCVVIVFFNAALHESVFSTVSFRKLDSRLFVLSLNEENKICVIMQFYFDM